MTHRTLAALFVATLAFGGCALFAPSKADLMAYCVTDPDVKKRAEQVGMTPEQLCEKLLRDAESAAAADRGDAGSDAACSSGCPLK